MKTSIRFVLVATGSLTAVTLASCLDAPLGPPSASIDALPQFRPPVVDSGMPRTDGGMGTDAGTDSGVPTPTDAGSGDGGMMAVDAGPPGIVILSKMHKLPPTWTVTDPLKLARLQPKDGGTEGLLRVGQLVRFNAPSTSDNTMTTDERCPNVFMGACSGFAALPTSSPSTPVLVDSFSLLGNTGMAVCMDKFNGAALPAVTGIWQGRLNTATMTTAYSIALASCSGVGTGAEYSGTLEAPASFDVQNLQGAYPTDGALRTVRGIVVAVQSGAVRSFYIQDPVGGPLSGLAVFTTPALGTADSGTATIPVPAVGDYVQVTGFAKTRGDYHQMTLP